MSTKCTILYGKEYHFFFDYKDNDYHLMIDSAEGMKDFFRSAGKILEHCPFSNSGIYMVDTNSGKSKKMDSDNRCGLLESHNYKGFHIAEWVKNIWNEIYFNVFMDTPPEYYELSLEDQDCIKNTIIAQRLGYINEDWD